MTRIAFALAVALSFLALVLAATERTPASSSVDPQVAAGARVYAANCAKCHADGVAWELPGCAPESLTGASQRYSKEQVDACIREAQNSVDPEVRVEAFRCIQDTMLDTHAFIPTYERARVYVVDPDLRDFVRRQVGADVDVARAYIVPPSDGEGASTGGN